MITIKLTVPQWKILKESLAAYETEMTELAFEDNLNSSYGYDYNLYQRMCKKVFSPFKENRDN